MLDCLQLVQIELMAAFVDLDADESPVSVEIQDDAFCDFVAVGASDLQRARCRANQSRDGSGASLAKFRSGNALWIVSLSASVTTRQKGARACVLSCVLAFLSDQFISRILHDLISRKPSTSVLTWIQMGRW